jgi:hypothetical protein
VRTIPVDELAASDLHVDACYQGKYRHPSQTLTMLRSGGLICASVRTANRSLQAR